MRMFEVCLHQIKENFKNLKFLISFLLILVLMIINGIIFSFRYERKVKEYDKTVHRYTKQLFENAENLNNLVFFDHLAIKKPMRFEFIAEGNQNIFPEAIYLNVSKVSLPEKILEYNKRLSRLPPIDWVFIVSILGSFVVVILTYDSISAEVENKTIRLVFSNSITKQEYILGKILGISLSVILPIVIGVLLTLILILFLGKIQITSLLLVKVLMFILISLIFILLLVSLGILISSITRSSIKSLIYYTLIWIVFVIITPVIGSIISKFIIPTPTITELHKNLKEADDQLADLYGKYEAGERGMEGRVDGFKLERGALKARNEIAETKQKLIDDYFNKTYYQGKKYYNILNISPIYQFQNSMEMLFNTGIMKEYQTYVDAKEYQKQLIEFYKNVDSEDNNSPHLHFLQFYLSNNEIDYSTIPQFNESKKLYGSTKELINILIILIVELVLITSLISFSLQKMKL